jgi:Nuclease-related domain/UvrD-like helicase C-terminal domain
MARMVPFPMLPTESSAERRLYERFLTQLGDDYVVYHSVDWLLGATERGGPAVQGEADFVIAHPDDGILVLEVKGGELSYDRRTRRWTQSGHSGRHLLDEDPFHQARQEMESLVQILSHQPGWERWLPSYGYGVAFPDGHLDQDAHPAARAAWAVDRDDLNRLDTRVREIMHAWRHPERRFGREGMIALEHALGFRMEVQNALQLRFDQDDRKIIELTDDQAYVLSYVTRLHRAAIVGPAGSGKTMLALAITSRLAGGGNDTLLTCFNWRLAEYLKKNLRKVPHAHVVHFHELCVEVASEAGLTVPPEPTEEGAARDHHFERVLPALLEEGAKVVGPRFDAVIVDGAQDFLPNWWAGVLSLHHNAEEGYLFLFADDNQDLFAGGAPKGLTDLTLALPENMRSTEPIHEFVSVFHGNRAQPLGKGPAGRPVEVLSYKNEQDLARLLTLVLKNLEGEGIALDDVAILTPGRRNESAIRKRDRVNGYELSNRERPGTVLTVNVHGFKGLERPVVILAEVEGLERDDLARYLYVGGSRARDHLIVLAAEPTAREVRRLTGIQAG